MACPLPTAASSVPRTKPEVVLASWSFPAINVCQGRKSKEKTGDPEKRGGGLCISWQRKLLRGGGTRTETGRKGGSELAEEGEQ